MNITLGSGILGTAFFAVVVVLVIILVIYFISTQRSLVNLDEMCKNALSQISLHFILLHWQS